MTNNQLFGVFAAQILAYTFENFPIAVCIPREEMQALASSQTDFEAAQRRASNHKSGLEICAEVGTLTKEEEAAAQTRLVALQTDAHSKEKELRRITAVLDGTVTALEAEGFIRKSGPEQFQLTFKGLAHLNKRFEEDSIQGHNSIADRIQLALNPANFVGSVASGTLVSLVGKAIGG